VRLTERVFLVGSGEPDLATTDTIDSQVYLVDGGDGYLCVDAGAGRSIEAILAAVREDGLDPEAIRWVVLTHGHADHAGGAAAWRGALPKVKLAASAEVGGWLAKGDEVATSVDRARIAGMYPLDYRLAACEIDRALAKLEDLAKQRGTAVGIASALPISIERIGAWVKTLDSHGIMLVPLTTAMLKSKSG